MRFFTPELYRQFNSPDDEEAERAGNRWEVAIAEYRRHLDELGDRLPSPARKLSELNLHDAELIGQHREVSPGAIPFIPEQPLAWTSVAVLSLQHGHDIVSLIYLLWDRVDEESPPADWPFSPLRKHWLYDEVDVAGERGSMFLHRVLFSDGSVMRIPFVSAIVYPMRYPNSESPRPARTNSKKAAVS